MRINERPIMFASWPFIYPLDEGGDSGRDTCELNRFADGTYVAIYGDVQSDRFDDRDEAIEDLRRRLVEVNDV